MVPNGSGRIFTARGLKHHGSFNILSYIVMFLGYKASAESSSMIYFRVELGCQIGLDLILILPPSAHSRGFV